jgi:acyl-CoA thioesterase I
MPRLPAIAALALCVAACAQTPPREETATPQEIQTAAAQPESNRPRIVILGDSLTAGLGLADPSLAYPSLLQRRLDEAGLDYEIVNAGVSGDTSAAGLRRLDWSLAGDVRILVLALGGNDGLRGLPPEDLKKNLAAMIEAAQKRNILVVLAGMEAPPNFGRDYIVSFHNVYTDLAEQYDVPLVPFLLDKVAGIQALNQRDGIHPTADGARIVADNVWPVLKTAVEGANNGGVSGAR